IAAMDSGQLWNFYIRYIGAGAVAAAGLITLGKTLPTIIGALKAGAADLRKQKSGVVDTSTGRTSRDLKMTLVLGGSVVIVARMWAPLTFKRVARARPGG